MLPDFAASGTEQGGTSYDAIVTSDPSIKTGFYSVHIWLLPFMEEKAVYDLIHFDRPLTTMMEKVLGDFSVNPNFQAFTQAAGIFICPSDPNTGAVISENNYRYNFGGSTPYAGWVSPGKPMALSQITITGGNGAFTIGKGLRVKDFSDGLSKTAFFSERSKGSLRIVTLQPPTKDDMVEATGRITLLGTDPVADDNSLYTTCLAYDPQPNQFNFSSPGRWDKGDTSKSGDGKSYTDGWPVGMYMATMYNHVATPNWQGEDCGAWSAFPDTPGEGAIVSARSYHTGIVNVCFGDGHVVPVSDTIDLTTWRALGSRYGGEPVPNIN